MRILGLNCRGLGNDPAVQALLNVQRRSNPDVMFLSETHLDSYPVDCLKMRLKMDFKIVNPSDGRSGGVLLLLRREINVQQIFSAPKYIDVRIVESPEKTWRLKGIYGEPRWDDKYKTWDKLRELNGQYDLPWAIIGDFNEIMWSHEKEGGNSRPQPFMQAFRQALSDCDLDDIGYLGDPFTGKRGRIREILDRVVVNNSWMNMHPAAALQHLEYSRSDHRPILLDTEYQPAALNINKSRRFHWWKTGL